MTHFPSPMFNFVFIIIIVIKDIDRDQKQMTKQFQIRYQKLRELFFLRFFLRYNRTKLAVLKSVDSSYL